MRDDMSAHERTAQYLSQRDPEAMAEYVRKVAPLTGAAAKPASKAWMVVGALACVGIGVAIGALIF